MSRKSSILGGALLVAGTSIGGGMLALPILTGVAGFLPSIVVYLLCWALMASTGLLILETSSWMPQESNLVSMAKKTLGRPGQIAAWLLYLFLFYSLLIAYIVGIGSIMVEASQGIFDSRAGPFLFLILVGPVILLPNYLAGKVNSFLMAGLIISYLAFVIIGVRYIQPDLLFHHDWSKMISAFPIAFTAFAYQGIVPTLISYLDHDIPNVRKAIVIGSFIPLIAYVVWQAFILGIIPVEGANGILEAISKGQNAVQPLKNFVDCEYVYVIGQFFAFFAMVTSFIGVTLGLRDFFADGLKSVFVHYLKISKKEWRGKLLLALLVFVPPMWIASHYPHIFLSALDFAGGFGCALLLGLLPILMVWSGRYRLKLEPRQPQLMGGKGLLILLSMFVLVEVGLEISKMLVDFFRGA